MIDNCKQCPFTDIQKCIKEGCGSGLVVVAGLALVVEELYPTLGQNSFGFRLAS
jgi:hypothetical protein